MSRDAIYQILKDDDELEAFGITAARVHGSNSTDTPDRDGPFLIVAFGSRTKAFGNEGADNIAIWAHMPMEIERSYRTIDPILERVKVIMLGATQVVGADGYVLTASSWQGDSIDLVDDGYKTFTRNSSFRIASRYAGYVLPG